MTKLVGDTSEQGRLQKGFCNMIFIGLPSLKTHTSSANTVLAVNMWADYKTEHDVAATVINSQSIWCVGINFMGPFPNSLRNLYILVAVDYMSKWVEVVTSKTNDNNIVVKFLKENIFSIISDNGTYFYNRSFEALMRKYSITHKLSTPYHL